MRRGRRRVASGTEVLALKHESRILGQWSNHVAGSSQFSMGQTAQRLTCSIMKKPHTGLEESDVRESYSSALEQGTLVGDRICVSEQRRNWRLLCSFTGAFYFFPIDVGISCFRERERERERERRNCKLHLSVLKPEVSCAF